MLPRLLEPEVMDTQEEASDYDSMDHSRVNRLFVSDFLQAWNGSGPVLDVGTGTAQIPIEFCRQAPDGVVLAIDAAAEMLKLARENVCKASLFERIQLQLVDAKRLPYPDQSIKALISNSIVHHIPQPKHFFAEVVRVMESQGTIFVRDLFRPDTEAELNHLVETYAGQDTPRQRQLFAASLHAALTVGEVRSLVAEFGFDRDTVTQSSDRHWTWCVAGK
jgi:ubiquinone/menaquinone biosynthesis C-methylase UbiE